MGHRLVLRKQVGHQLLVLAKIGYYQVGASGDQAPLFPLIPAVTLGITHGENYYSHKATMEIDPMFKGIAQIIGVLEAIDSGVCDGK